MSRNRDSSGISDFERGPTSYISSHSNSPVPSHVSTEKKIESTSDNTDYPGYDTNLCGTSFANRSIPMNTYAHREGSASPSSESMARLRDSSLTRSQSCYSSATSLNSNESSSSKSTSGSARSLRPASGISTQSNRSSPVPGDNTTVRFKSAPARRSPYRRSVSSSPRSHRSRSHVSQQSGRSKRCSSNTSQTSHYSGSQTSHTSKHTGSQISEASGISEFRTSKRSGSQTSRASNRSYSQSSPASRGPDDLTSKGSVSPTNSRPCSQTSKDTQLHPAKDSKQGARSDSAEIQNDEEERNHDCHGLASKSDQMKKKKQGQLIDSDSELGNEIQKASEQTIGPPTADALFGDASDISSDDDDEAKPIGMDESFISRRSRTQSRSRSRSRSQSRVDRFEEGAQAGLIEHVNEGEKEKESESVPETRIDVEIPKITTDLGREIHFVKLPNFLSVETRPFDHETYEDEIDEEETLDEEGRARLKLKVENTIRWKDIFNDDGKSEKQSNARFVRWSDGNMSLHLGSEIFDVYKQPLQGDHNHLFIRQGTGLQGQAVFRTKLTFRPHSTESFTHRKMTMSLADRSQKTSGIKVLSHVGMNPDQNKCEMIKKEEEKLRLAMRTQSKPKKSGGGGRGANRVAANYGNELYHDDVSDDENAISLAAIKRRYKKSVGGVVSKISQHIYSSDEEGSDFEAGRPKKHPKSKVLKDSDEESESDSEAESSSGGENEEEIEKNRNEN